jgi:hypothetical protein
MTKNGRPAALFPLVAGRPPARKATQGAEQSLPRRMPKGGGLTAGHCGRLAGELGPHTELSGVLCRVRLTQVGVVTGFTGDARAIGLLPARPGAITRVGTTVEPRPAYPKPQIHGRHFGPVTARCNAQPRPLAGIADSKHNAHNGIAFSPEQLKNKEPRRVTKGADPVAGKPTQRRKLRPRYGD